MQLFLKRLSLSYLFCNFATAKLLKYNMKRILSICMLMLATLLTVASSVVPHHHNEDGDICIIMDMCNDKDTNHGHASSDCEDDCAMNIDLMQDASQIGHASKTGLIPQLIAILASNASLLPEPIEQSTTCLFVYILHTYHDYIGLSCGMRAPPAVA